MTSLIGIGGTGCAIVDKLSQYPQYTVLQIDEGNHIQKHNSPEEYELHCPDYTELFTGLENNICIFLSACGNISGISLRVIEQLKHKNISVILILSDDSSLGKKSKLQQKVTVGVLQEYARSGLLQNLYLISNNSLEPLLNDIPLDKYYSALNELICYVFNSVMWCRNNKPLMETKDETDDISRIGTYGILDLDNNLTMFYPLQNTTKERYYYNLTNTEIKTNFKLLQKIKAMTVTNDLTTKTFAVYKTEHGQSICFVEARTHIVQPVNQEQ